MEASSRSGQAAAPRARTKRGACARPARFPRWSTARRRPATRRRRSRWRSIPKPFMRILHSSSGFNTLITLKVQGEQRRARAGARACSSIRSRTTCCTPTSTASTWTARSRSPCRSCCSGESRGVKQDGGVLDFVHREIEVEVPAGARFRTRSKSTSPISASATRFTCATSRPTPRGRRSAIPT